MHLWAALCSRVVITQTFFYQRFLGIAISLLFVCPQLHGVSFDIEILTDTVHAGLPTAVRIVARTIEGHVDPTFEGTLALSAQTFRPPSPVLTETEVSADNCSELQGLTDAGVSF